ncbi:MAG TPA: formyltransferase family protein [Miltoncostaea sp.]|nr:formyltransferase family protein [Miltoncostaea sp.]
MAQGGGGAEAPVPGGVAAPHGLRIAWFGHDWGLACAEAALARGHRITHLFTEAHDGRSGTAGLRGLARRAGAPVVRRPPTPDDLARLERDGADLMVAAGYRWRIPVEATRLRGLNVHPSLLPEIRGPVTFPWVILGGRDETGVTVHALAERFDEGPVLRQEALPVGPDETYATLSARSRLLAARLLPDVLDDLDGAWARRTPQGPGRSWPFPDEADRTLPLAGPVADIDRVARAFPAGTLLAVLGGRPRAVARAAAWPEPHGHRPGAVVQGGGREVLVAAADGYVLLALTPRPSRPRRALARARGLAARVSGARQS